MFCEIRTQGDDGEDAAGGRGDAESAMTSSSSVASNSAPMAPPLSPPTTVASAPLPLMAPPLSSLPCESSSHESAEAPPFIDDVVADTQDGDEASAPPATPPASVSKAHVDH
jgi:hypothetical protein